MRAPATEPDRKISTARTTDKRLVVSTGTEPKKHWRQAHVDTSTVVVTVLSSSFLAAIITSLASGLFSLRLKRQEFLFEYHKKILEKRIAAYERIEALIGALKGSVLDDDGMAYHQVFAFGREGFHEHLLFSQSCMVDGMWLSARVTEQINQLNYIFLNAGNPETDLVNFGKRNYRRIGEARQLLEKAFAEDISSLHDITGFLNSKAAETHAYNLVQVERG